MACTNRNWAGLNCSRRRGPFSAECRVLSSEFRLLPPPLVSPLQLAATRAPRATPRDRSAHKGGRISTQRREGATTQRGSGRLLSSFSLHPSSLSSSPAPFPLQNVKEQARERHTGPYYHVFVGMQNIFFCPELTAERAEYAEVEGGELPPIPFRRMSRFPGGETSHRSTQVSTEFWLSARRNARGGDTAGSAG